MEAQWRSWWFVVLWVFLQLGLAIPSRLVRALRALCAGGFRLLQCWWLCQVPDLGEVAWSYHIGSIHLNWSRVDDKKWYTKIITATVATTWQRTTHLRSRPSRLNRCLDRFWPRDFAGDRMTETWPWVFWGLRSRRLLIPNVSFLTRAAWYFPGLPSETFDVVDINLMFCDWPFQAKNDESSEQLSWSVRRKDVIILSWSRCKYPQSLKWHKPLKNATIHCKLAFVDLWNIWTQRSHLSFRFVDISTWELVGPKKNESNIHRIWLSFIEHDVDVAPFFSQTKWSDHGIAVYRLHPGGFENLTSKMVVWFAFGGVACCLPAMSGSRLYSRQVIFHSSPCGEWVEWVEWVIVSWYVWEHQVNDELCCAKHLPIVSLFSETYIKLHADGRSLARCNSVFWNPKQRLLLSRSLSKIFGKSFQVRLFSAFQHSHHKLTNACSN